MTALARALWAETLKTKRTLALAMTVLAPLIIAVLQFSMYIQNRDYYLKRPEGQWLTLYQNSMIFWSLLMMPLFVTLETALLSGLEYGRKNWTLLFTMPLPRWTFYAAKELISLALIAMSTLTMLGLALLDGIILQAINPGYGLEIAAIPWVKMASGYALIYLASFLIISIHQWVSSRWPNFVVAFGVGIAATVASVLIFQSDWGRYFPWSMPGLLVLSTMDNAELSMSVPVFLALGAGGGLVLALIAGWHIAHRDVL